MKSTTPEPVPEKVMKGLVELKAFALKIPKEYGGLGFSQTNYLRALTMVSRFCGSTAALLSAHQSIGVPSRQISEPMNKKRNTSPDSRKGPFPLSR